MSHVSAFEVHLRVNRNCKPVQLGMQKFPLTLLDTRLSSANYPLVSDPHKEIWPKIQKVEVPMSWTFGSVNFELLANQSVGQSSL